MDLERINVKFFVEDPSGIQVEAFIHVFNAWIQASEGQYYDIADYSHVHSGPGILLIAHDANISMDNTGSRLGLLYNRKQPLQGSNGDKLLEVFKAALENCRRIEEEPLLRGRIKFRGNEALFLVNDRLLAPNGEETFRVLRPDLEGLARVLYAGTGFHLEPNTRDPGERFSVRIRTPVAFDVAALLKNLEEGDVDIGRRAIG